MNRILAFLAAILLATIAVSSASFADGARSIRFTLRPAASPDRVQLSLNGRGSSHDNIMSSSLRTADLPGLDGAGLGRDGPIAFALVREAGRLDCSGLVRSSAADGGCRFTPDPAFSEMLAAHGMARPTEEQAFALAMIGARRDLLDALAAAHYPMPDIDDFIAMSALEVNPGYIADMARSGYRPSDVQQLIEFRAVGVTPEYAGTLARAGYTNLPADKLVELAALNIDPAFIRGFESIGYPNLPVDTLVELKALDVTPGYVDAVRQSSQGAQSLDRIVELKALGFEPAADRR